MQAVQSSEVVTRLSRRMINFMLLTTGHEEGLEWSEGLPAGSVLVPAARLILAGTSCTARLFDEQMLEVSVSTGADVLLMRHGHFPELLDPVFFDLALNLGGHPTLIPDLLLYHDPEDGFWVVPSGVGPSVAIEADGLRVAEEPPYIACAERTEALLRAARLIAQMACPGGRF